MADSEITDEQFQARVQAVAQTLVMNALHLAGAEPLIALGALLVAAGGAAAISKLSLGTCLNMFANTWQRERDAEQARPPEPEPEPDLPAPTEGKAN